MKLSTLLTLFASTALLCCGCSGYRLGSAVPEELRTIHVPAFENQTEYPMVGAIASQQFLDCLIEEGIFTPTHFDDARLRVHAIIKSCSSDAVRYDRNNLVIPNEYYVTLTAELHVFDAQTGETYIKGKSIIATDTMLTRNQYQTGIQDILPRLARRLARNLVDEINTIEPNPIKPLPREEPTEAAAETSVEATEAEAPAEETTEAETPAEAVEAEADTPTEEADVEAETPAEELPAEAETPAEAGEAETPAETPAEAPVTEDDAMAEAPAEEVEAELPAEAEAPAEEVEAELPAEAPVAEDDAMAEAPAEVPAEAPVADDDAMAELPAEEAPTQVESQE